MMAPTAPTAAGYVGWYRRPGRPWAELVRQTTHKQCLADLAEHFAGDGGPVYLMALPVGLHPRDRRLRRACEAQLKG